MGTIVPRKRADGSTAYTAQIRMKRKGVLVHSEAQTFDRVQAARPDREDEARGLVLSGPLVEAKERRSSARRGHRSIPRRRVRAEGPAADPCE